MESDWSGDKVKDVEGGSPSLLKNTVPQAKVKHNKPWGMHYQADFQTGTRHLLY